ncbi:MAG: hypothetical protein ACR2IM_07555 [Sediminibacterium sp.]
MSKIQTNNWLNKSEAEVTSKLGPYKTKSIIDSGYMLLFDYSLYSRTPIYHPGPSNIQPSVTNNNIQIIEPTRYVTTSARPSIDNNQFKIIKEKVLEFYFDKNKKVTYVNAIGYPDSIKYELKNK